MFDTIHHIAIIGSDYENNQNIFMWICLDLK